MRRPAILRVLTLALAFVHSFPARGHLTAFVHQPSLADGWKGFGALVAMGFYLAPVRVQARALATLWSRRRTWLRATSLLLVAVHVVPALDHLPRFAHDPSWHEAWRGLGAALAIGWFLVPQRVQARFVGALARLARIHPTRAPWAPVPETNS